MSAPETPNGQVQQEKLFAEYLEQRGLSGVTWRGAPEEYWICDFLLGPVRKNNPPKIAQLLTQENYEDAARLVDIMRPLFRALIQPEFEEKFRTRTRARRTNPGGEIKEALGIGNPEKPGTVGTATKHALREFGEERDVCNRLGIARIGDFIGNTIRAFTNNALNVIEDADALSVEDVVIKRENERKRRANVYGPILPGREGHWRPGPGGGFKSLRRK